MEKNISIFIFLVTIVVTLLHSGCSNKKKEIYKEENIKNEYSYILKEAVNKLKKTKTFNINVNSIRSYSIISSTGKINNIYGEFKDVCYINKRSDIKASVESNIRYQKDNIFTKYNIYYFQEKKKYYKKEEGKDGIYTTNEIPLEQIPPYSYPSINVVLNYSDQAVFVREEGEDIIFELIHPRWFEIDGLLSFANLGILTYGENTKLIQDYVEQHYPNVLAPKFTIVIDKNKRQISQIELNDSDTILSILEINENVSKGTNKYKVNKENKTVLKFYNYNMNKKLEIPR